MNCLNYKNKITFIDYIKTMSKKDINLHRKAIYNLLETIKFDYNMFRSNLYSTFLFKANKLSLEPIGTISDKFRKLLKQTFLYCSQVEKTLINYQSINNSTDDSEMYSREESIDFISKIYDKITNDSGTGYYNMFKNLVNLVLKQSAIMFYKLYAVALLNRDFLKEYANCPKMIFGGLDENNEPDYENSLKRYQEQIIFDIDYVESDYLKKRI